MNESHFNLKEAHNVFSGINLLSVKNADKNELEGYTVSQMQR